jgi:glycosyltransferase involved in cell wall biosynthesis
MIARTPDLSVIDASPLPRRCLVIAGVFPPAGGGGALRMTKLLKHLPRHGWQPVVIAPRSRSGWFADPELLRELGPCEIQRVGLPGRGRIAENLRRRLKDPNRENAMAALLSPVVHLTRGVRNAVAIPDEALAWSMWASAMAARRLVTERFDLLLTASFPYSCHLAGLWLRRAFGVRWLADFADPWALQPIRGQDRGVRRYADLWLEAEVVRRADGVSVVSPGMLTMYRTRYAEAAQKLALIRNSFEISPRPARPPNRAGPFTILFVGTFDHRLSPATPLCEAVLRLLAQAPELADRLRVRVLGGADLETRDLLARRLGTAVRERFSFEGYATHRAAQAAMHAADVVVLSVAPGAYWHLTAKIYEYLGSGTPILAAVPDGDSHDLLTACGGAAVFYPEQHQAMADALVAAMRSGVLAVAPRDEAAIAALHAEATAAHAAAVFERTVANAW